MNTKPATKLTELKNPDSVVGQDLAVDFFSKNGFELAIRIAKAFSTSDAVPAAFRQFTEKKEFGKTLTIENSAAIGNCLVAIEVAKSVDLSMISVMQNADVIQGKLRWSSKFQIAAVNASGRFSPLRFKLNDLGRINATYKEKQDWDKQKNRYNFKEHTVEIDNWECIAWAYVIENGKPTDEIVQSIPVTMQMAVEEGWYAKDGSKWQGSMRFQMLQYRAGTFFASIYAPDVIMGMGKSTEEHHDIIDVFAQTDGSYSTGPATLQDIRSSPDVSDIDGGVSDDNGSIETKTQQEKSTETKPVETKKAETKPVDTKTVTKSDEPTPEEQEKIRQQLIREAAAERESEADHNSSYNLE
ncbi:MAG: hypothetical protein K2Q13_10410 [Nitrosomonas sp.]|uniref:hypothetical protein n=1 Tax=Nitrosomonas sp. TaxID=42353 RepID=UPI0025FA857E|nr:hypothetical protein [Nitrosomonas sp.]MBY0475454.1 hypothetical protein [Nitrosomonas sp.]